VFVIASASMGMITDGSTWPGIVDEPDLWPPAWSSGMHIPSPLAVTAFGSIGASQETLLDGVVPDAVIASSCGLNSPAGVLAVKPTWSYLVT
jgi:hypothetical protein